MSASDPAAFNSGQFTPEELALLAAFVANADMSDEIWLGRVMASRLAPSIDSAKLDKLGAALARAAGRIDRMKARQARATRE